MTPDHISEQARKCVQEIFSSAHDNKELHQADAEQIVQHACIAYHEAKAKELTKNRDEHKAVWEIDRKHELIGPVGECGCPSCNLHHRYQHQAKQLRDSHRELVEKLGVIVASAWPTAAMINEGREALTRAQEL